MIGLIKKDFMLIVKSISPVYLIAVAAPSFVVTQNPQYFLPILTLVIAFMFAVQVTTTMSLDENVKWRKSVTAMPITPFQEAASKYVLTLLLAIMSSLIVLVIGITIGATLFSLDIDTIIMYTFFCFSISLLYNTIVIPAAYKYGTAKSRYFLMLSMVIAMSIPYLGNLFGLNMDMVRSTDMSGFWLITRLVIFVIILLSMSLLLSIKIIRNLS
ncbi:ABC-2 transporter permease [Paenibacillus macerans]|uniref:ABC-2 transporter permease n=1 Tax=Paenibacillus macerans TaxID=44252 RepID=UPI002040E02F|nr:ABC-2 transporter permease [Paenibacillus macerans]MCM3699470.1 ABC-2 transporter permease [Paenibacillus macerans]